MAWYMRYGKPEVLVSDQGSHFRNEVIELLYARLKVQQSFTPVYSLWVNGTIERVNKDVLQEWLYLLPVVQANINHTPVESLGNRSPIELFLGLPAPSALDSIVAKVDGKTAILSGSIGGVACNFDTGDYVLWSRVDKRISTHKLLARWVGPFKVVQLLPNSFMIKHLITGTEYEVHGTRLKFYSGSSLNITEEITELIANQGMLLGVRQLVDHRFNNVLHRWEFMASWAGLTSIEDSWESAADMQKDVPAKVSEYMERVQDEELSEALGASTDAN
ncbi:hypothetical protein PHMEG_00018017 [Phytophthora megakarya]|uniref:Chromo domain-containing protein n=1 Tax=Phytophthora megakarya TaxID=4795 RepID=A0A225VVD8_9STRA|nr:hypothetical protein PHMEG_00018017 [Phytophthora megakarya]